MIPSLVAAVAGALAMIAAFPTVSLAWPALLAYAPLLVTTRGLPWRRRLLAGWAMGFLFQLVLFRWIVFTMEEMSNLPTAAGIGCLVAFSLWHGLMSGVFLAAAEPARRSAALLHPSLGPLAVAASYAAVEWLWPILFPWSLGHAFWEEGSFASIAALAGVPGMAFAVMAVNAAAAELWVSRRATAAVPGLVAALALFGFGAVWDARLDDVPVRRTLRVAVLQMNYTLEEKKHATLETRKLLLERLLAKLRSLPRGRFDLVVGSEGAYPVSWVVGADLAARGAGAAGGAEVPLPVQATRRVAEAVREGPGADTILGGLRKPEGGRTRNAAVLVTRDGRIGGHYDKNILVPFGEYLPGSDLFPALKGAIDGISDFEAGDSLCRLEAAGERVACGICYESIFAGFTRETAGDDAALLVNMTIDVWFGRTTAPWFHLMVQSTRAAELGVPLVRSALTGISAVVGPDGVPLATLPLDTAGVLEVDVPLRDVSTPYRAVGPVFAWLALLSTLVLLARGHRARELP